MVCVFTENDPFEEPSNLGKWRSQLFGLLTTLGIAIISGALTVSREKVCVKKTLNFKGSFLTLPCIERLEDGEYFEDAKYWDIDEEDET